MICAALLGGLALTGCNDSFLEKYPVTSPTEENAFQNYDNFQAFMWPCYEVFNNTTIALLLLEMAGETVVDNILAMQMPDI